MIYAQPNSWQCGPFALKHALMLYGTPAHEDRLARLAGSTDRDGTDEAGLDRAARAYGVTLRLLRRRSRRGARRELRAWLARGVPVLLCLDQWDHWVTAVADLGDRVALFDSHFDHAVFRGEPWGRMLDRLVYRERILRGLWRRTVWDVHPILPLQRGRRLHRITPERAAVALAAPDTDTAIARELGLGRERRPARPLPVPAPRRQHQRTLTV